MKRIGWALFLMACMGMAACDKGGNGGEGQSEGQEGQTAQVDEAVAPFIGTWSSTSPAATIKFNSAGHVRMQAGELVCTGTFEVVATAIGVDYGDQANCVGGTLPFSFSGDDQLTVGITYTRVNSDDDTSF